MAACPALSQYIIGDIRGGSTPAAYLFYRDHGIPFIKTSAVTRHFVNVNDLQRINVKFHHKEIKRSITYPYDVIYTMTGKFMGKAAMCPPTITEMNMSQNSVVLHTASPRQAVFLTIFLNSQINRIQVRGTYSITKQKFMNQGKIAALKVMEYDNKYDELMQLYLDAFQKYFDAVRQIQRIIESFNNLPYEDTAQYGFIVKPNSLDKRMLIPNFYRPDIDQTIQEVKDDKAFVTLCTNSISKGNEIGSANYLEEGIPFIKTSDIINYDVDYEPDCYCVEALFAQLKQDIRCGDIIFAKDGKPGEAAVIQKDSKIIISSGLVKYRPRSSEERYWVFLLLASKYGEAYFKKWFVIASTMLHLRADFFNDFAIPEITDEIRENYMIPLAKAFEDKKEGDDIISKIKAVVEESFTNTNIKLKI